MTFFTDCMPCQYGMHEHHHSMVQAAPEGGFGGAECPCTGDCATRNAKRIERERLPAEALAELPDLSFLREVSKGTQGAA